MVAVDVIMWVCSVAQQELERTPSCGPIDCMNNVHWVGIGNIPVGYGT